MKVEIAISYRYGLIFRRVIATKPTEWCSTMDGSSNDKLMLLTIDLLKTSAPSLFHNCPYLPVRVFNSVFPLQIVKRTFKGSDEIHERDDEWRQVGIIFSIRLVQNRGLHEQYALGVLLSYGNFRDHIGNQNFILKCFVNIQLQ